MRTPWASFPYTWLFPSPDKSVGAKDTQKGPGVSCCKPETLVDSAPITYSTRVDRDGPNYQSDLSDLRNQGHYIREPRTLPSNGISALWIDSTVFQRAGIRTPYATKSNHRRNGPTALIYVKLWQCSAQSLSRKKLYFQASRLKTWHRISAAPQSDPLFNKSHAKKIGLFHVTC